MKIQIVYVISLMLLCVSCSVEEHIANPGLSGNYECCTVRMRIPDSWKIINAQLEGNRLHLEYDRGRGIQNQIFEITSLMDFDGKTKFRGANRIDGLVVLYFTKDEVPQHKFNPPLGTYKITTSLMEREEFAIFRTSNWLVIHYSIKNTGLGELTSHDLTRRYARKRNNKGIIYSFKNIDGKMHYNLFFNNKEKRSFLIDRYYGQHETYGSYSLGQGEGKNELSWRWQYEITSNQVMDK